MQPVHTQVEVSPLTLKVFWGVSKTFYYLFILDYLPTQKMKNGCLPQTVHSLAFWGDNTDNGKRQIVCVSEEMKKMKMFFCVKNRLLSLCFVFVNGHSYADTVLKTNCKDEITGAWHDKFLDLDRNFSPSITRVIKKRVMILTVKITEFLSNISTFNVVVCDCLFKSQSINSFR